MNVHLRSPPLHVLSQAMARIRYIGRDGRALIRPRQFFRTLRPVGSRFFREVLRFLSMIYIMLLFAAIIAPTMTVCHGLQRVDHFHLCTHLVRVSRVKDCLLNLSNISPVLDRFLIAHLAGWAIKATIVPSRFLLWIASVSFEVVERVAIPLIPSLRECWWDSLLMDIFLCNAVGIEMGLFFAFTEYEHVRSHVRLNLSSSTMIIIAILLTDLNAFLLKDALTIRDASPLNVYRILLFIALAPQCVREITSPKAFHSKMFTYTYALALLAEISLVVCKWPT